MEGKKIIPIKKTQIDGGVGWMRKKTNFNNRFRL